MNLKYELYYNQFSFYPWIVVEVEYSEDGETRTEVSREINFENALKFIRAWEQPRNSFGVKIL